ncbi:MAG: Protein-glutamate methylesterase/protein-glutamine glutaminase [Chroococcopsis gigantea SAG 12.99]|nr:Protein-glutamate methylesterase/protein-glutamine glutaminase [Chroococcopsis gigantea SAG 12.99]
MLSEQGYYVRAVTNGPTALKAIEVEPPQLILLDIQMTPMNGYQVCTSLKSNSLTADIPVIFISGSTGVFDKVKAFSTGGADYVTKPFQIEEVLARIENQLSLQRLQGQLRSSLAQERSLNRQIQAYATVEERNRIARDIHDSLGHSLVALNIQLEAVLALWATQPGKAYEFLVEAKQLGTSALQAVRESVSALREESAKRELIGDAIAPMIRNFSRTTNICPDCDFSLCPPLLNGDLKSTIYRVIQEALTNICKYAGATRVSISIKPVDSGLELMITDNGRGFSPGDVTSGFGLRGMRERIEALGGQLTIVTGSGKGCCLQALFPHYD